MQQNHSPATGYSRRRSGTGHCSLQRGQRGRSSSGHCSLRRLRYRSRGSGGHGGVGRAEVLHNQRVAVGDAELSQAATATAADAAAIAAAIAADRPRREAGQQPLLAARAAAE